MSTGWKLDRSTGRAPLRRAGGHDLSQSPAGPVSLSAARALPGLRLVVLQGVPSPWSQAAKAILRVKQLPYTLVHRAPNDPPGALEAWTGQASFPAAMYESERPRTGWAEILLLAERLAPAPLLVPADPEQRAFFFGLCHELCGEMGLGWARRLEGIAAGLARTPVDPIAAWLGGKYGYSTETAAQAPGRVRDVLGLLAELLARSRARGSGYLLGAELTALDLYWATFCNLVSPLPPELLALPAALRPMFTSADPAVHELLGRSGLLAHRDRIYREHLELPVPL
jgi:glutathione S-transferase